ncbi:MAG TPA: hypothetical protein VFR41_10995, partial [Acidimicrobiia bacterium]|nr:hypothetical protein [Acidimicrobiia bacterium]
EAEGVATTSSVLDSDGTNPLQMFIAWCDQPFDQVLVNGTYPMITGCSGNLAMEYAGNAVFAKTPLPDVPVTPGTPQYLAFVLSLPEAVATDPSFMGQTSVIRYTLTADQRAGVFK